MGGDDEKAKGYARRAADQSPGYIENHVVQAEIVDVPNGARKAFRGRLDKAIAIPDGRLPGCVLEQRAARKRARKSLDRIDEWFD